jgi:hypothetical protein
MLYDRGKGKKNVFLALEGEELLGRKDDPLRRG